MGYTIGIDLGGTNIAVGVMNENFKLISKTQRKTRMPRSAKEIFEDMVKAAAEAAENASVSIDKVKWIGVGTPGIANPKTGSVDFCSNLAFYNEPMKGPLEALFQKPVMIENDANCAAYGEYIAGAAKGANDAIVVTLGTGIGGGIILDGKIVSGFNFAGAELGHMVIQKGGRACGCGRAGCFEQYASATGLIRSTKEAMEKHRESVMWVLCKNDLSKVNGRTAFDAMRQGDEAGIGVVNEFIDYLACGVANIINIFAPEMLCIGGGISKEGETVLKPLREIVCKEIYSRYSKNQTKIVAASLGNDAGIIGAAALGLQFGGFNF